MYKSHIPDHIPGSCLPTYLFIYLSMFIHCCSFSFMITIQQYDSWFHLFSYVFLVFLIHLFVWFWPSIHHSIPDDDSYSDDHSFHDHETDWYSLFCVHSITIWRLLNKSLFNDSWPHTLDHILTHPQKRNVGRKGRSRKMVIREIPNSEIMLVLICLDWEVLTILGCLSLTTYLEFILISTWQHKPPIAHKSGTTSTLSARNNMK